MIIPAGTPLLFKFPDKHKRMHSWFYERLEGKFAVCSRDLDTTSELATTVKVGTVDQVMLSCWVVIADNIEEEE